MELYLGSIIEPIQKSIRNMLYFNSKHAPKTLGEAMQKAQDLHIKHLYAVAEDQDSVTNCNDVLPEITVNEVTSHEDRGWYRNKRDFQEHSQNSRDRSPQRRENSKQVTFNQPSEMRTKENRSEYSDSSRNLRVPNNYSREQESDKASQQPSVIRGSFTQIMVNPMQLQDHEFTAWLDRWLKQEKIDKKKDNDHTETSGNHTTRVGRMVIQHQDHLYVIESNQPKSWKYNKLWTILTVNTTM